MTAWRLMVAVMLIALGGNSIAHAETMGFRCKMVTAADNGKPDSRYKWRTFKDDHSSQPRVFSLDVPCEPGRHTTGGGFNFDSPFDATDDIVPWKVVGSLPYDQTTQQPANSWRCVAAWTGPTTVPIKPPYRLWCHAMCCRWTGVDR